ncbi:oxidoreductase 2-nitropropane dioxygenase [Setomelanomma holmii]|uniref:Oxidoreductase 2-nitropropane dioxygenase n=1 Tax=Setomelanomma holmii TaxID=210430 RepID=A0A9P4HJD6_9PLEO|nr:oxidoreductase 2-nitropropane dioxygenase [Setomelanomma holmii]
MASTLDTLRRDYPWIQTPLVVGAPMRLIALADMAVEISKAGGIGFIGAGTDVSDLDQHLDKATSLLSSHAPSLPSSNSTLPVGVGFINWGADLPLAIQSIAKYRPAATWFFAPSSLDSLKEWTSRTRQASPSTRIWVQIGSVEEAISIVQTVRPDVLVVQGTDAGGHGLAQGASLISLLPEVSDTISSLQFADGYTGPILLAAGGIVDSRGASAAHLLGASGVVLGTRLLASTEANVSRGYQSEVLRASDGGQTTVRTKVYDKLRGTTGWAESHNARGIVNRSYVDALGGMSEEENRRLYEEEVKKGDEGWGEQARMTTYAGSGVGLVREVKGAGEIVREVREGLVGLLGGAKALL